MVIKVGISTFGCVSGAMYCLNLKSGSPEGLPADWGKYFSKIWTSSNSDSVPFCSCFRLTFRFPLTLATVYNLVCLFFLNPVKAVLSLLVTVACAFVLYTIYNIQFFTDIEFGHFITHQPQSKVLRHVYVCVFLF